jgi:glycine C-acetyltransferase
MTGEAHRHGVFVLPVVSPAVPPGLARLRATITSAHEADDIEEAMNIIQAAGEKVGVLS